jgi:DNA-binding NtrC family response regulator
MQNAPRQSQYGSGIDMQSCQAETREQPKSTALLVGPDPGLLVFLGALLECNGIRALRACNSEQARQVAAIQNIEIDLVLADIRLGTAMIAALRQVRPGLPVIYMAVRTEGEMVCVEIVSGMSEPSDSSGAKALPEIVRVLLGHKK